MDHLEKNALREVIHNYTLIGDHSVGNRNRLYRLKDTAFFGRVDFKTDEADSRIYVGVHHFQDHQSGRHLVYDWRAPVSSLFYDYEPGEARYTAQSGIIKGNISLKRQFRIRKGQMEFMLDTDLTIHDDVLQQTLSQASDAKMKNIVSAIQKEQNAVIRNEEARHLIIQGLAGSGKTSIALHRIAFLLYRFKNTISSDDVLIISPNKVFASYISNVLPELGEEKVAETSMEEIADALLEYAIKFQNFFDQVSELLSDHNSALKERIQFKSSSALLKKMDEYLRSLEQEGFRPVDIIIRKKPVPAWFIEDSFKKYARLPLLNRFNEVVQDIVNNVSLYYQHEIKGKERTELHQTVRKMFPSVTLKKIYKDFYQWMGRPELLKMKTGGVYEWNDVFPLIYLKMKLEGIKPNRKVRHLVIDEMQDYSAVQYTILRTMYPCQKTILGDINQSVNPFASSNLDSIQRIFPDGTAVALHKSYRSSYEITEFSKDIIHKAAVEAVERHGKAPEIIRCKDAEDESDTIKSILNDFQQSDYHSLGVICKTQQQANHLYDRLKDSFSLSLFHAASVVFGGGIAITTAHMAKGLEFDRVLVFGANAKNYQFETDRHMLYVACTRAMHELCITYTGSLTGFLEN